MLSTKERCPVVPHAVGVAPPTKRLNLNFSFLCTFQIVFQKCSSALDGICHLLINSVPDECHLTEGIFEDSVEND